MLTTFRSKIVVGLLAIFSISSFAAEIRNLRKPVLEELSSPATLGLFVALVVSIFVIGLLFCDSGTRIERFVLSLLAFEVLRKFATALLKQPSAIQREALLIRASCLIGTLDAAALVVFSCIFAAKLRTSMKG